MPHDRLPWRGYTQNIWEHIGTLQGSKISQQQDFYFIGGVTTLNTIHKGKLWIYT